MKIGIDARTILNPEKNPAIGVGHYTYQLIKNLLQIDRESQYEIFFDYRVRDKDVKKFSRPNVKIKYFPWSDYKKYLPGAYSEILGLATLGGKHFDVLHATSPDARIPLGYRGKAICTFQDLAVFKYPKLFSAGARMKASYNRQAMAKRCETLIAVSENTKKDLIDLFKISEQKVRVIKNGIDQRFFAPLEVNPERNLDDLKREFGINEDFILFVGTLEPIKNITRLLQAFKIYNERKKDGKEYQLVLAGKSGWLAKEYSRLVKDLGLENSVKFLGYVEGEDLKKLYRATKLFVMPSLYEGFGMTVLEAMACQAPCLISDLPPLRDIAGESASYLDPLDIEDISQKIDFALEKNPRKLEQIRTGQEKAREFSWDKCAKQTLEVYHELAKQ